MTTTNLRPILITGAATGIGLETTRKLIQSGEYQVIGIVRDSTQAAELQALADPAAPTKLSVFSCDLKDAREIQKLYEKVSASHKTLYALVNNAGIYPFGGIANTELALWNETLSVNLTAPFLLTQTFLPLLRKSEGGARVLNISSTAGILPNHFALAYSVSKAGLIHFTKTLAKELGPEGITVNCICPGIVKSPMHDAYHHSKSNLEAFYAKKGAGFPMGRVGEPSDVAHAALYFLSPGAAWVTGDVLLVDGGRLLV